MADDVTVDPGTTPSVIVATDELAGARHVQLFKLLVGGDGVGSFLGQTAPAPVRFSDGTNFIGGVATAPVFVQLANGTVVIGNAAGAPVHARIGDGTNPYSGTNPVPTRQTDGTTATVVNANTVELQAAPKRASTGAATSVATSTTSAQLLASNTSRLGAVIRNDSTSDLYIRYGTTAVTTDPIKLLPDETHFVHAGYTGRLDGILLAGTGNARILELT